ncbi:hypothetical protein AB9P05_17860 [Roseivirga sp. BDSF3-8]|uniref:hypothetical protein n=1 Tax=Roseivirga sp. BDSF3-8 TaxID=3241598 RepID=UPI0035324C12
MDMLSDLCMRLFKHILPPNELRYMLAHWFGKSREEIREQMLRHGFVARIQEKPAPVTEAPQVPDDGAVPAWVVDELNHRLQQKGLGAGEIRKVLAYAGMRPEETDHLPGEAAEESNAYSIFKNTLKGVV